MIPFFKALFAPDPAVSFGRVASFVSLICILTWDSVAVGFSIWWNVKRILPGAAPLALYPPATELLGQAAFISAFYAFTKAGEIFSKPPVVVVAPAPVTPPGS